MQSPVFKAALSCPRAYLCSICQVMGVRSIAVVKRGELSLLWDNLQIRLKCPNMKNGCIQSKE